MQAVFILSSPYLHYCSFLLFLHSFSVYVKILLCYFLFFTEGLYVGYNVFKFVCKSNLCFCFVHIHVFLCYLLLSFARGGKISVCFLTWTITFGSESESFTLYQIYARVDQGMWVKTPPWVDSPFRPLKRNNWRNTQGVILQIESFVTLL